MGLAVLVKFPLLAISLEIIKKYFQKDVTINKKVLYLYPILETR